ncbi:RNA-binding ATPase activator esf2 [Aspergillus nanangensis]|uniref:Pre-rRNA-processing protein ESF2 n=1 Tax=Aspergillus nanangensis TaxID=2582783 RepID=A0AAD4CVG6_ASPNN|nr:RNA-binding ATPase activator esf2 [Aspergillus nanangensis]
MTSRKRNEFLDIASSDDEASDRGYDSEIAEETKGRKRRRQNHDLSGSEDEAEGSDIDISSGEEDRKLSKAKGKSKAKSIATRDETDDNEDLKDADQADDSVFGKDQYLEVASPKLERRKKTKETKKKTGVIYLSSLPPYLKPWALAGLLQARGFGPITKVFLAPEVRSASAPRRRSNKRKLYTDGWVEFASKSVAKRCAETLNASIVGGRKGSFYYDDIWNMKYLRGFKWSDLMEQVQRERSEREAKQRIEDTRARKEDKVFLQGVESGKVLDGIQKKNEEKRKRKLAAADASGAVDGAKDFKIRRTFKQNEVKMGRDKAKGNEAVLEDDTKRVLGKIF